MFNFSWSPFLEFIFESATLCCLSGLLLLSIISLAFVFHLHLKSQNAHQLQRFNSLWTVRFLLVSFITFWAFSELLHLSFFRKKDLFPFLPFLTLTQQANFCKIHVVLSLGLFQPGFLITQLFLVNVSVQEKTPHACWAVIFVFSTCFPILFSEVLLVFFSRLQIFLPDNFLRSWVVSKDDCGHDVVLCAYPIMNSIVFGAFGIWYLIGFSFSFFKVANIVINKRLRARIYGLAIVVLIALPLEIIFLGSSVLWVQDDTCHYAFEFFVLVSTLVIAATGEGILVIKPIVDSLAAGEDASSYDQTLLEGGQRPQLGTN